jgi:hypothetical protein
MTRSIDDSDVILGSLELPEGNVDGDPTFTLSLQFIKNPGIFKGALAQFRSFLLKFLDGSLIDSTAFVDQVASSRGLARVDMSVHRQRRDVLAVSYPITTLNTKLAWVFKKHWVNLHINVSLFLTHV